MWRPFLLPGESVLLQIRDVSVKSTNYTLILTSNRLLLIDPADRSEAPPLQIARSAILRVEAADDTHGRPALRLSTGTPRGVRSLLVVFPSSPGETETSDRDTWLVALRGRAASACSKTREQEEKRDRSRPSSSPVFSGRMFLLVGIICLAVLIGIAAAFVS